MRITVVIHSLTGGGSEHVAALLASRWADEHSVTLVTLDAVRSTDYAVTDRVQRVALDVMKRSRNAVDALVNNARRWWRLRQALRAARPDVVISFTDKTNVLTLLSTWATGLRVVACERTQPQYHSLGRAWAWLRRRTYPRAAALVVQTAEVAAWAESLAPRVPIHVIPNFVLPPRSATSRLDTRPSVCLGLGRLSHEKGFDLLVDAFARIADRHPDWRLRIVGEGSERPALEAQIRDRGLAGRADLPGWSATPDAERQQASVFVLPSRYEGFPNALLEAMAAGLACVSFACPSGPAEIVRDGVDGCLVPPGDVAALAAVLDRLFQDADERQQLGERAREVLDRFGAEASDRRWAAVVERFESGVRGA